MTGKLPSGPPGPILALEDLHVHRGDAHVLQGVSFEVRPRQVTALLGRNGAGKSTTLLAVLGRLPCRGVVRLRGRATGSTRTPQLVRSGVGYVPEDREVFTSLTVAENLRLAMRSPDSAERLERVHTVFPELASRRDQRAGSLSGGQQQMVALARALLNPNDLMLIDEPTKGLAPAVVDGVVELLAGLAGETTILLVEQNLRVATALAQDAVVLDHGVVAEARPMAELAADEARVRELLGVAVTGGRGRA